MFFLREGGGRFGPNRPKSGPNLGLIPFSQEVAQDDSLEHCLTNSRAKTHGKNFVVTKLGLKFSQGCIISFP